VQRVAAGLHRWTAYHHEWKQDVGCLALRGRKELILIDPLVEEWEELDALARDRRVHVLLTIFWHARSSREVVERYGAALWSTAAGRRRIANRAGQPTETFEAGHRLPGGVHPLATGRSAEVVFWLPKQRALAVGDVLLGSPFRLCPRSWLPRDLGHDGLRNALRPLLELPVERVLVSHGEPVLGSGRDELARLLA
jgi:glyoxylase-like metal-dependent hydrolase (beta-lactamase superfamily II)